MEKDVPPDYVIERLTSARIDAWLEASLAARGEQHLRRLIGFAQDLSDGKRVIWAVWQQEKLVGQLTLQAPSAYPPFRRQNIHEIVDVWVDPAQRRQGIAKTLLQTAGDEARARQAPGIGLGVGVTENFGPAHRLYAQAGFLPDGAGLWVQGRQAKAGDVVTMADGVLLMWVKIFSPSPLAGEGWGEGAAPHG